MWKIFNRKAEDLNDAETALKAWHVQFEKLANGQLVVDGDLNCADKKLKKLPDLSKVIVNGNFNCGWNELTSLEGSPASVGGNFRCEKNKLSSLKGATRTVGKNFNCEDNQITSLDGAPNFVGETMLCSRNPLGSLDAMSPNQYQTLISDLGNRLGTIGREEKQESQEAAEKPAPGPVKISVELSAPVKVRKFRVKPQASG